MQFSFVIRPHFFSVKTENPKYFPCDFIHCALQRFFSNLALGAWRLSIKWFSPHYHTFTHSLSFSICLYFNFLCFTEVFVVASMFNRKMCHNSFMSLRVKLPAPRIKHLKPTLSFIILYNSLWASSCEHKMGVCSIIKL